MYQAKRKGAQRRTRCSIKPAIPGQWRCAVETDLAGGRWNDAISPLPPAEIVSSTGIAGFEALFPGGTAS